MALGNTGSAIAAIISANQIDVRNCILDGFTGTNGIYYGINCAADFNIARENYISNCSISSMTTYQDVSLYGIMVQTTNPTNHYISDCIIDLSHEAVAGVAVTTPVVNVIALATPSANANANAKHCRFRITADLLDRRDL